MRNTRGEILYKTRSELNVRKIPWQAKDKVQTVELQIAVSMTCHCAIRTVDHVSEIMIARVHCCTLVAREVIQN